MYWIEATKCDVSADAVSFAFGTHKGELGSSVYWRDPY
jgi:hypothetical protein